MYGQRERALSRRRDRKPAHLVALDEARDEARGLRLFDEVAQERRSRLVGARRADGLLHGSDLSVENPRPCQLGRVLDQTRTQTSECLQSFLAEKLERAGEPVSAHQLGVLQRAAEEKIERAAIGHGDPNARAIMGTVQTSRGCPFECEFCDVIQYLGRKQRHKPIDLVLAELDQLYLPNDDDTELQLQAFREAGYSDKSLQLFGICLLKRPSGYVRYYDNQYGRLEPVRGMQVWT